MSAFDAVDGSSTGTRVPKMWALLVAPTNQRSSPCKQFRQLVSTSPSRFFKFTAWMLTAIRRQLKRRHVLAFFEKLPPCLVGIEAYCLHRKIYFCGARDVRGRLTLMH